MWIRRKVGPEWQCPLCRCTVHSQCSNVGPTSVSHYRNKKEKKNSSACRQQAGIGLTPVYIGPMQGCWPRKSRYAADVTPNSSDSDPPFANSDPISAKSHPLEVGHDVGFQWTIMLIDMSTYTGPGRCWMDLGIVMCS